VSFHQNPVEIVALSCFLNQNRCEMLRGRISIYVKIIALSCFVWLLAAAGDCCYGRDHRYGSIFVRNGCWLLLVVAIVMVGFSILTTACCCWRSPL